MEALMVKIKRNSQVQEQVALKAVLSLRLILLIKRMT